MLPEDRLQEARKQIDIARSSETLTEIEREWLGKALRSIAAAEAILDESREEGEDAEVIE